MEKIANGLYRLTFGEPEELTPVSVLKPEPRFGELNARPDYGIPFPEEEICCRRRAGSFLVEVPLSPEEDLYGLGLMLKSFRQTGRKKLLRANSDPAADTGDSHAPVPFYLSTAGYCILIDTARYVTLSMGNCKIRGSRQDREGFESAGTEYGHWWVKAGSGNLFIDIPAARGVELYVFCGEDMKDALARYNLFSGGGVLPPIWGLGVMYRAYMHGDRERIYTLAKELRKSEMPCDIFGLEPGWQTHFYSCTYQWDEERFPDHQKMLTDLADMGFKVNLWEHAYVNPQSPVFEDLKPYAGDQYVWDGLVPDFATEEAQRIFADYHAGLAREGISGFKLDECDNSDFTANWGFADFTQFPSGLDGEQMHTLFGALYQKTIIRVFEKENVRTWGEVRNATAFAAPNPYVLYSDLYDHEDFVRGMASASCSGILWTPEVRQAESEEELLVRIAAAVVSPQMVINSYQVKMPPWVQWDTAKNLEGERLPNADELTQKCRSLLNMRMKLIPWLYAAYYTYYEKGIPPIRPLVLDYPDDQTARPVYDEYLLGEGLLAAPVIFGKGDRRRIWLPKGNWYDYDTGFRLEGGQWMERKVRPGDLPLFVREGTLLALAEPEQYIGEHTCFRLHLTAYGAEKCSLTLISDDGVSCCYQKGVRKIQYTADRDGLVEPEADERYCVVDYKRII